MTKIKLLSFVLVGIALWGGGSASPRNSILSDLLNMMKGPVTAIKDRKKVEVTMRRFPARTNKNEFKF